MTSSIPLADDGPSTKRFTNLDRDMNVLFPGYFGTHHVLKHMPSPTALFQEVTKMSAVTVPMNFSIEIKASQR